MCKKINPKILKQQRNVRHFLLFCGNYKIDLIKVDKFREKKLIALGQKHNEKLLFSLLKWLSGKAVLEEVMNG